MNAKPHIAIPEPTSFDRAYNQRSWPQYARAVELSGGVAVPVPLTESQATVAKIISGCAGILLPGSGADLDPQKYGQTRHPESADPDPARESVDELLLQEAFNLHKPILGICYGLQSMNVWRNGSLQQHIPGHAPGREVHEAHALQVDNSSQLADIVELSDAEPKVNSSHHQAIDIVGDGLTVVARSEPDGIIEAVEGTSGDQFVLGVQWHPERTFAMHASSRAIFEAFVRAASEWKLRPITESVSAVPEANEPVSR
jgi:putative glutamine amidotransferase